MQIMFDAIEGIVCGSAVTGGRPKVAGSLV